MAEPGRVAWFRKPTPTPLEPHAGGTLNATYQLLDRAVVAGGGDDAVLREESGAVSHAALLEQVAAFGGVLRGLGVSPGDPVAVDLSAGREAVVALLAAARIGAVAATVPAGAPDEELVRVLETTRPVALLVADDQRLADVFARSGHRPGVVVSRAAPGPGSDSAAWEDVIRAGRTDPAPAVALLADAPSLLVPLDHVTAAPGRPFRTTLEQAERAAALAGTAPMTTADLLTALFT